VLPVSNILVLFKKLRTCLILKHFSKINERGETVFGMAKIRTEISIESSESLIIKRKRYSVRTFCEQCQRISIMVLPTEAAFLSCRDVDSIISLMYENRLHVRYVEKKGLYVCLTSLCLYKFENDPADAELEDYEEEAIKILGGSRTENFSFVNED
jgi:hypothetical protein